MRYTVLVGDNFHYQDESERYKLGDFATAEEALAAARKIVDDFLTQAYRPGMTAQQLYSSYAGFGEDPFIVSDDPSCSFSAWDYARKRCAELAGTPAGREPEPPAADEEAAAPSSSWNEAIQATIDIMAYGYEVQISVNGATLPFKGGKSQSGRLFGTAEGAGPLQPAVLLDGENQLGIAYRRTGDLNATLEITIRGPSGDPLLRFGPLSGEEGRLSATFRLGRAPREGDSC